MLESLARVERFQGKVEPFNTVCRFGDKARDGRIVVALGEVGHQQKGLVEEERQVAAFGPAVGIRQAGIGWYRDGGVRRFEQVGNTEETPRGGAGRVLVTAGQFGVF